MKRLSELTVDQALEILKQNGSGMGSTLFRAGIEQGAFPFAIYFPPSERHNKKAAYIIYKGLLMKWISERLYDEPADDDISVFNNVYGGE